MGGIRKWLRGVPLPAAFIICALCCILAALGLTKATIWFAEEKLSGILDKYKSEDMVTIVPTDNSEFIAILGVDKEIGSGDVGAEYITPENNSSDEYIATISPDALIGFNVTQTDKNEIKFNNSSSEFPATVVPLNPNEQVVKYRLEKEDQKKYDFFSGLNGIAAVLWYSICLVAAALVFYFWKIRKPLNILNSAVQKVSENDLNFSIDYEGKDELGRLCQAFEVMRQELVKSNRDMWNSIEERKRLNAAFAHDLRTPLTVMRGYVDLLQSNFENDINSDESIGLYLLNVHARVKQERCRRVAEAVEFTVFQSVLREVL